MIIRTIGMSNSNTTNWSISTWRSFVFVIKPDKIEGRTFCSSWNRNFTFSCVHDGNWPTSWLSSFRNRSYNWSKDI